MKLEFMGYHQAKAHDSDAYFCNREDLSLSNTQTIKVLVKTPSTTGRKILALIRAQALLGSTLHIYEAPTVTDDGTELIIYNKNRGGNKTAVTKIYHTPTATGGTLLKTLLLGDNNVIGDDKMDELLLAKNTDYLIVLTSNNAANKGMVEVDLVEA